MLTTVFALPYSHVTCSTKAQPWKHACAPTQLRNCYTWLMWGQHTRGLMACPSVLLAAVIMLFIGLHLVVWNVSSEPAAAKAMPKTSQTRSAACAVGKSCDHGCDFYNELSLLATYWGQQIYGQPCTGIQVNLQQLLRQASAAAEAGLSSC